MRRRQRWQSIDAKSYRYHSSNSNTYTNSHTDTNADSCFGNSGYSRLWRPGGAD